MTQIYAVGETILDIIFKDGVPMAAKPGGSSFNAAISMGRLGLPVTFISELGQDQVGDIIIDFLEENTVDSAYVSRFKEGKTAIALAFLNAHNDAEYQFYKDYPYQRLAVEFPEFTSQDFLLFGSFYALNPGIRPRVKELLNKASEAGALLFYDPNFRDSHLNERDNLLDDIIENIGFADIVRASDEDLKNIFDVDDPDKAWELVRPWCDVLIYTANSHGVHLRTSSLELHLNVDAITPLSTIGAGDTFNAGVLYGLYKQGVKKDQLRALDKAAWTGILHTAASFAKEVCLSYENYLSFDFIEGIDTMDTKS